jgi:hypothetical protein
MLGAARNLIDYVLSAPIPQLSFFPYSSGRRRYLRK